MSLFVVVLFVYVYHLCVVVLSSVVFFFQAEDGIRDLVRSRGLGDVYKRQSLYRGATRRECHAQGRDCGQCHSLGNFLTHLPWALSLIHISEPTRPY